MTYIWRTDGSQPTNRPSSRDTRLGCRIGVSCCLFIGVFYFCLIFRMLGRWGGQMERNWRLQMRQWIEEGKKQKARYQVAAAPSSSPYYYPPFQQQQQAQHYGTPFGHATYSPYAPPLSRYPPFGYPKMSGDYHKKSPNKYVRLGGWPQPASWGRPLGGGYGGWPTPPLGTTPPFGTSPGYPPEAPTPAQMASEVASGSEREPFIPPLPVVPDVPPTSEISSQSFPVSAPASALVPAIKHWVDKRPPPSASGPPWTAFQSVKIMDVHPIRSVLVREVPPEIVHRDITPRDWREFLKVCRVFFFFLELPPNLVRKEWMDG